ncbi:MAG TPA: DUF6766 family protein [Thermoanaerobaculia bacterium]|nr:DUF6766 family protein [Thermoanaerobaculia bacterium]
MWRRNGLSIALFVLFVLCLVGHSISGWKEYNEEQREHGEKTVSLSQYLRTSSFGESVFENWESEFLQMAMYVMLTAFLQQKGSAESKDLDDAGEIDDDPHRHRGDENAPWPVRRGGWILTLYRNSLSIAFFLLFAVSLLLHARSGAGMFNEESAAHGTPTNLTTLEYATTSQFWFESFQNWQSEFLAVFAIVVLSIWLRQWGSPESKPVHAPHSATGAS